MTRTKGIKIDGLAYVKHIGSWHHVNVPWEFPRVEFAIGSPEGPVVEWRCSDEHLCRHCVIGQYVHLQAFKRVDSNKLYRVNARYIGDI